MIRTQTATIVFTDIVDSTPLSVRKGHDGYEALRRAHFDCLRMAASVHQGMEIKSTGDGLVFAFTSAAEAVACAIRMDRAVDWSARREGESLRIRIGASSGETNRDSGDIFGHCVVEAARLCAAAAPGEILISGLVRGLIRGLDYKLRFVGDLALKGLGEPVPAYAVEWTPREEADDIVALPRRIASQPKLGLFGRARELALLNQCWTLAREGRRQLVLLGGEPGIGKTRLGVEAAHIAHKNGAVVLFGVCDESVGQPYRPFAEALEHYLTHAPDEVIVQHVREHRADLARIAPALTSRMPGLPDPRRADTETERYLMFEAVVGLLAVASQQRPIVMILDDLQWAGAPELLLLKHIVRSATPMRLLIIVTYRDTELAQAPQLAALLADLRRESDIERIALRGLDEEGVVSFISAAIGHELDDAQTDFARVICRNTEGSPLFVEETLRHVVQPGVAFGKGVDDAHAFAPQGLGIPEGVKEAIGRRLGRLSEQTNKILTLAAVIGLEFDLPLLTRLAGMPEDDVLDAIDEASAAALVTETHSSPGCYAFTHMLMRAALYEALNTTRRARTHERVGLALEHLAVHESGHRIDELARHWLAAASVGDASKAVRYAHKAGDQALARLAFEQAADYYEQALALVPKQGREADALRCDLLVALGDAQRRGGDIQYRETVAQAVTIARTLGDARRFALAALGSARPEHPFANANVLDQSLIALYEEALEALNSDDEIRLRARLHSHLAGEMLYTREHVRRGELARTAVALARKCGDETVLAQALNICASAINDPMTLKERVDLTIELETLAETRLDTLEIRWSAAYQRMGVLLESGDAESARRMLSRMRELSSRLRQPFFHWGTALADAMFATMTGEPEAEEQIIAAFQSGSNGGQPEARQSYFSQLSLLRRNQGRYEELLEPIRAYAMSLSHVSVWRIALAGLYCETDQLDEARQLMDQFMSGDYEISLDWTWASAMINLAQLYSDLNYEKGADFHYSQMRPVADQVGVTGIGLICYGSLAFPCGQFAACLRRWDEAERYFKQAIEVNTQIGARPYLVRSLRAYAKMLLDRRSSNDDQIRAGELIDESKALAAQLGMARELIRLERLRQIQQDCSLAR